MKKYVKPTVKEVFYLNSEGFASLSQWLLTNELTDAGITTYIINS